jgi:hypothetical protein
MKEDQLLALMAAQIAGGYTAKGVEPEFAVRMSLWMARAIRDKTRAEAQRVA